MNLTITSIHELVIAGVDFDTVLRGMNESGDVMMTGRLVRNSFDHVTQWCVQSVRSTTTVPRGGDHALLQDWFVVDRTLQSDAEAYRRRFDPLPGQRLVVLAIADGVDNGKWQCVIFHRGQHELVERVSVVGISNLVLDRSATDDDVDLDNPRWSRLRHMFGDRNLRRIRRTHVMIFGASRNGSIAARQLAALGFGKLTLVDPDILEPHNYDAMLGGSTADFGRPKVAALADELVRFRDDLAVTGLPWTATDRRVISRARGADILMTCVDHGTPVLLAAKMANRWNKVHIDVGTSVQHAATGLDIRGDVRFFQPHEACAVCVGGIGDRQDAEIDMQLPMGATTIRPKVDFRDQRAGSLVTINSITVAVAVQMILESICRRVHSCWHRIAWSPELTFHSALVERVKTCDNCGFR